MTQGNHEEARTYKDPVEMVAETLWHDDTVEWQEPWATAPDASRTYWRSIAVETLEALSKAGFLSDLYFDAMKAKR